MLIPKLAFRNLLGAGLRTWLNVIVLSVAFVAIIWTQGMVEGTSRQIMNAMVDLEYGGGQYWHARYDRYDPLTINEAHAPIPDFLAASVRDGSITPLLICSASIFPEGRLRSVLLKGIDPGQNVVNLPAHVLAQPTGDEIPALIGARMSEQTGLKKGDVVTVRWRDVHGTFDATDIRIAEVMHVIAPSVDTGIVWLPLDPLREMLQADNEATLFVLRKGAQPPQGSDPNWRYLPPEDLLADIIAMVKTKTVSSSIVYALLLFMGLLAIFDTQVLSIFRRRKEIGTIMALGMPRQQVIRLFTFEGALHGILALLVGAIYGIPILYYSATRGIPIGDVGDQTGFAIPERMYLSCGAGLVAGTTLLILISVTLVSFLPSRRISRLKPTLALKGRVS